MSTRLNEMARDLVGTESSPFFVIICDDLEFDGAQTTIAAFTSIEDASGFAEGLHLNANELLIIEGPSGTYLELTQSSRATHMESGRLAISTPFGKAVVTTN